MIRVDWLEWLGGKGRLLHNLVTFYVKKCASTSLAYVTAVIHQQKVDLLFWTM